VNSNNPINCRFRNNIYCYSPHHCSRCAGKDTVEVSSKGEDVNNATSTSTVDSSMVVRSGQESHVNTTTASVNTTSHSGDVACKVDKSILVMTHVLQGAFGLEHSPAFTIANRLYMALDMNGQRKLDQVLYEIPTELGLQHFTVKMLEMFRHAINDLGMVFTIEQVAMVHETFAPVVVEIMKFMYQVDGYPDKGMYSLASYMNSTVSLMDTLQQSIRSCFQHVTHCHDNIDYYYFDETSFCLRTCALIGRLDITRRLAMCQKQEVMDNCPHVCGTCCEDDPSYEIIVQNHTAGYIRGCSWLTEDPNMAETRRAMYCDDITEEDGRMIRHYCPLSCDSCVINGPTLAPTLAPTATPTNSNAPTLTPIEETQPPVHDPTLAPTVQVFGNCKAYTSNIGQGSANNSICEQAFHLTTDSSLVCGEIIENQTFTVPPVSCSVEQTNQGPPSWYTLEGTGERIVITTCAQETTFDTLVSVYEFALCSSTSCQPSIIHDVRKYPGVFSHWTFPSVAANDDDDTCIETGTGASTVVFDSVAGQMYKLYVSEKGPGRQGGTFGLKATSMMAPANDRCETAINLNTDGVEVIGSTVNATIDWEVVESCAFSQQNIRGASVWYTLEGTGERIVITTCSRFTDMNTILAVYDQSHCNSYTCLASTIHDVREYSGVFKSWTFPSVAANDDDDTCIETGTGASTVVFDSVAGQMYKLYVSEKGPGRQGGTFGLKATSMMAPANDRCETAINLNTDGVEVIGSTVNATIDWEVVESCAFSQQNIRGASVWYRLQGTGGKVRVTTCSMNTTFDTVLAVYNDGFCDKFTCFVSNDNDSACNITGVGASTVTFDTVSGQIYKFYVSSKSRTSEGQFGLIATTVDDWEDV
jgi:hypothetical protein